MLQQFLSRLVSFRQNSQQFHPDQYDGQLPSAVIQFNDNLVSTDYNPDLITNLINEHKDIIEISNSIKNLAQEQEWHSAQEQLKYLADLIATHMNAETITLYRILEHIHAPDSLEVEMIKFIRQEMAAVGIDLLLFIKQYSDVTIDQLDKNAFMYEYSRLLHTLIARIELEKSTLYPLYEILLDKKK